MQIVKNTTILYEPKYECTSSNPRAQHEAKREHLKTNGKVPPHNEDELSFARRCHQMTKAMHAPRYRLRRG